jgi:hypothetical protein
MRMLFLSALALTLLGCSGTSLQTIECDVGINCTPTPAATALPAP